MAGFIPSTLSDGLMLKLLKPTASKSRGPTLLDAKGEIKSALIWKGETLEDATLGLRGKIFSMGSFLSSPAVGNRVLYVGSVDGNLYALAE